MEAIDNSQSSLNCEELEMKPRLNLQVVHFQDQDNYLFFNVSIYDYKNIKKEGLPLAYELRQGPVAPLCYRRQTQIKIGCPG